MAVGTSSPVNSFGPHALNCLKLKAALLESLGISARDSSGDLLAFSYTSLTAFATVLEMMAARRLSLFSWRVSGARGRDPDDDMVCNRHRHETQHNEIEYLLTRLLLSKA
ncbi:hypothetical protein HanRHA438_Chr05g0215741 [Helianthus annuus]|nr:hypothetical protein HanRHA438_Chr05g0215741 [Helianthus annuus]